MKIVATTSLPAVDRPNADRWNAARSRQLLTTVDEKKIVGIFILARACGVPAVGVQAVDCWQ